MQLHMEQLRHPPKLNPHESAASLRNYVDGNGTLMIGAVGDEQQMDSARVRVAKKQLEAGCPAAAGSNT